jgi:hypothetical protein
MASYRLPRPSRPAGAFSPTRGGSWREKGRGNAPGHNPFERKEPSDEQIMEDLTDKIDFISLPASEVEEVSEKGIVIDNFEALASYSWDDSLSPTIIVPGK